MRVVRCRRPQRLPNQSKKFIDNVEHACVIDHSIQYLFDKASHLGYRTKLTGLVNATRNLVSSGFPSFRINLSPFTKDFRGGEQLNESVD